MAEGVSRPISNLYDDWSRVAFLVVSFSGFILQGLVYKRKHIASKKRG